MIELAKACTTIDTPINKIFQYATNLENYGEWFPGIVAIRSANQSDHATVGKTYLETVNLPTGTSDILIEVNECIPNQHFLTKGNLTGILPQMTMTFFSKNNNCCLLSLQYHSRNVSLAETGNLIVALKADLSARATTGLHQLKHILEGTIT